MPSSIPQYTLDELDKFLGKLTDEELLVLRVINQHCSISNDTFPNGSIYKTLHELEILIRQYKIKLSVPLVEMMRRLEQKHVIVYNFRTNYMHRKPKRYSNPKFKVYAGSYHTAFYLQMAIKVGRIPTRVEVVQAVGLENYSTDLLN